MTEDREALLKSLVYENHFSVRFNQSMRGDSTIKTIEDLISRPIEILRKMSGFKDSCEKELLAFKEKNGL
jgi:hypothetical protein